MPDAVVDLSSLQDPVFKFKLSDGKDREIDPLMVMDRLDQSKLQTIDGSSFDMIRKAFDLPTEEEAKAKGEHTPTRYVCLALLEKLYEFCGGLEVSKKLSAHIARQRASMGFNPPNG